MHKMTRRRAQRAVQRDAQRRGAIAPRNATTHGHDATSERLTINDGHGARKSVMDGNHTIHMWTAHKRTRTDMSDHARHGDALA